MDILGLQNPVGEKNKNKSMVLKTKNRLISQAQKNNCTYGSKKIDFKYKMPKRFWRIYWAIPATYTLIDRKKRDNKRKSVTKE